MSGKLGILAGRGEVPARLIAACRGSGRELFVLAFNGETDPVTVAGVEHAWTDIAAVGRILTALRDAGCRELCLIGLFKRPDFSALRPDWTGLKLLPRLIKAARQGDGALLTALVGYFEQQGFAVVGAEQVMAELSAPSGALGQFRPDMEAQADIAKGIEVVRTLGRLDIGQAAVVRDGLVLAVEAAEGTDAMLQRCLSFRRESAGGVLVKLPKPRQERRIDLPTIGVPTVEGAAAAGLAGIAVEAGGALVVDREAVARRADELGLFVVGFEPEDDR